GACQMNARAWKLIPLLITMSCGGDVVRLGTTAPNDGGAEENTGVDGGSGDDDAGPVVACQPNAGPSIGLTLTNLEYDNTVRDLVGYPGSASADFMLVEGTPEFDFKREVASPISPARLAQYAKAAAGIAAFVVNRGVNLVLPCDPQTIGEELCLK